MNGINSFVSTVALLIGFGGQSIAGVCDYRPSELIGGGGASIVGGVATTAAATGVGLQLAGVYTLTHSVTGLTMIGSTLAGGSAAGTVGIIAGTGGLIGSTVAVLTAPVTVIAAVVTAAGVGIYEGACYFGDEEITDTELVRGVLEGLALSADPEFFKIVGDELLVKNDDGEMDVFKIEDLYIVNGVLKNDDWFFNTVIGNVAFVPNN